MRLVTDWDREEVYSCAGGPRIEDERGIKGVKVLAVVDSSGVSRNFVRGGFNKFS